MNTNTPETDAQHLQFAMGGFTLDFCRQLERERDEAREQRDRLEESILNLSHPNCVTLIRDFCEGQGWAAQTWKNQPHIKPLFDFDERQR